MTGGRFPILPMWSILVDFMQYHEQYANSQSLAESEESQDQRPPMEFYWKKGRSFNAIQVVNP